MTHQDLADLIRLADAAWPNEERLQGRCDDACRQFAKFMLPVFDARAKCEEAMRTKTGAEEALRSLFESLAVAERRLSKVHA